MSSYLFRWKNWSCKNRKRGDQDVFDLFSCNKRSEIPDDDDDNTNNILPDLLDCVDEGVKYKGKKNPKHTIDTINNVASADECRTKCSETNDCLYWTWIGGKNKKTCTLMKKIKITNYRRKKKKAVSGTLLNGCNPKQSGVTTYDLQHHFL